MFIETFKYEDFDENPREETCCFHMSESDLTDLNIRNGGLPAYLQRIIEVQDNQALADLFKGLIIRSYGVKSLDGRKFDKSAEVVAEFMQTPMYDQLYMHMLSDTDYALKFIVGILPKSWQKTINEENLAAKAKAQMEEKKAALLANKNNETNS